MTATNYWACGPTCPGAAFESVLCCVQCGCQVRYGTVVPGLENYRHVFCPDSDAAKRLMADFDVVSEPKQWDAYFYQVAHKESGHNGSGFDYHVFLYNRAGESLPRQVPDWDDWFLELAAVTAKRSKDPKRQVGCVIVHPQFKDQRSGGYNGMVAGIKETPEVWQRPLKYDYVCHAEANAVAIAARNGSSLEGCTTYITCFPCLACTRLLLQAGIKRIVVTPGEVSHGYVKEYQKALALLKIAGVAVKQ